MTGGGKAARKRLAEDAILEAKAVVAALRRMLDQLAEHP
jgi:hypothetical protein